MVYLAFYSSEVSPLSKSQLPQAPLPKSVSISQTKAGSLIYGVNLPALQLVL